MRSPTGGTCDLNRLFQHKLGVVLTLHHRAKSVITEEEDCEAELVHVKSALGHCGYPDWAIKQATKVTEKSEKSNSGEKSSKKKKCFTTVPYIKGVSEELKYLYQQYGVQTTYKPFNKLRQLLCAPKDKLQKEQVCGAVYHISCLGSDNLECLASYIGETERTLKAHFAEHRAQKWPPMFTQILLDTQWICQLYRL